MYRYKLGIKSGCIKVKQLWYLKVDKILVCDLLFYHVTIIIVMAESAVFTFGFPKILATYLPNNELTKQQMNEPMKQSPLNISNFLGTPEIT